MDSQIIQQNPCIFRSLTVPLFWKSDPTRPKRKNPSEASFFQGHIKSNAPPILCHSFILLDGWGNLLQLNDFRSGQRWCWSLGGKGWNVRWSKCLKSSFSKCMKWIYGLEKGKTTRTDSISHNLCIFPDDDTRKLNWMNHRSSRHLQFHSHIPWPHTHTLPGKPVWTQQSNWPWWCSGCMWMWACSNLPQSRSLQWDSSESSSCVGHVGL